MHTYNINVSILQATEIRENKSLLSVNKPQASSLSVMLAGTSSTLSVPPKLTSDRFLMPTADIYPSKAMMTRRTSSETHFPSQSDTSANAAAGSDSRTPSIANGYTSGKPRLEEQQQKPKEERRMTTAPTMIMDDLDVQSIINERRPSRLRTHGAVASTATSSSDQYSAAIRGEGYGHIYAADDRSDELSPCGNASESGTGSISVAGSLSAAGSISCGSGSGSRSSGVGGVHIGEGGAIGSDVRIYVDDTDSSSNGQRRGRPHNDETLDASTTVSSTTTMRDGDGGTGGSCTGGSGSCDGSGGGNDDSGSADTENGREISSGRPSSVSKSINPS